MENNQHILKVFGERIKTARLASGMNQEELAEKIKSSRSFVSSLELGKTNPSLLTILKICQALSIQDINFLLDRES